VDWNCGTERPAQRNNVFASRRKQPASCLLNAFLIFLLMSWNKLVQVWRLLICSAFVVSLVSCLPILFNPELSRTYLLCVGREEQFSYNLADFYRDSGPAGLEVKGSLWHLTRGTFNLGNFSMFILVPIFYLAIFMFRSNQAPVPGVSETERQRRKQSNLFTTKITFIAWLIEVTGFVVVVFPSILGLPARYMVWMIQSGICPPCIYAIIAEKDNLRTLKELLCYFAKNSVGPIAPQPQVYTVNT